MSLCKQLVQHWNGNVVILMAFSSLVALKVVTLTTFSATSDENFIKMMTFLFQWKAISKQHCYGIQKQHWPSTKAILTQHKSDTDPVQKRFRPGTIAILSRYKSDTVWYRFWYRFTTCLYRQYRNPLQVRYWYTVLVRVPERCARRVSKGTVSVPCTVYNDTEPVPFTIVEQYRNGYRSIPECLLGYSRQVHMAEQPASRNRLE